MATNSSYNFTKFSKPPRSLALVYEVQLQEIFDRYEHTPCTERAAEWFIKLTQFSNTRRDYSKSWCIWKRCKNNQG